MVSKWLLFLVALISAVTALLFSGAGATLYFYSPETTISNYVSLKIQFDTYLSEKGNYRFQPFSEREIFEQVATSRHDGVYFISSWYFARLRNKVNGSPVLVGLWRGSPLQRKILSSRKGLGESLQGKIVASAGTEEFALELLRRMSPSRNGLSSSRILIVPKEIDALMSVGFGVAQMALTSEGALQKLSSISPKQYERLELIARSDQSLLPVVVLPNPPTPESLALLEILQKMPADPEGRTLMALLGLDGWKEIGRDEIEVLNR